MRGHVTKRGSGYAIRFDKGPDPVTGKRRQEYRSGFRTKKEAESALAELIGKAETGSLVERSRQSVREYLEEWIEAIEATVRPSTLHSYRRNIRVHVIPRIGGVRLQALDGADLNLLYRQLLTPKADGGAGLAPRTVRYIATILRRALKDAVRWSRLLRNPSDAADPPRPTAGRRIQYWDAGTLAEYLNRSRQADDRYLPLWTLLATTGARRGEILGLRWQDVDLKAKTASIVQTVIAVDHEVQIGTPKTAKGRRSIVLDEGTVTELRRWRKRQAEERLLLGAGYRDHDLIFAKPTGEPLHPERVSREFVRRVERWDLPPLTLHGLRHTWATLALKAGVHPKVVQERLGHSTIAITLETYSHVTGSLHEEAAEQVADLIRAQSVHTLGS
jgi:integrase